MGSDDSKRALGKRIPNLVVVVDSEQGAEFRVQCEVVISDVNDAALLSKQLRSKSKKQIGDAKKKLEAISAGSTIHPVIPEADLELQAYCQGLVQGGGGRRPTALSVQVPSRC